MTTNPSFRWQSRSPEQSQRFGEILGSLLQAGDWLALYGDLGAGKTTLVAGLARGLKIQAPVSSPTYLLCHEYEGETTLFHLDAYFTARMESLLLEGLAERLAGEGVVVLEWAEHVESWLPKDHLALSMEVTAGLGQEENSKTESSISEPEDSGVRDLTLEAHGPRSTARLHAMQGQLESLSSP